MYDVSVTRNLSEGITGYEVRTNTLYGRVTSLSEGSLYIDVDTDSHSVVSLEGKEDVPREYMMSTGMVSSLYESTVWEQITGYESVSTISILAEAQEENIDILLISKDNLDTELEKLNTDEATRQAVINAVNSGKVVTIPAEDVTIGDWHGIGYIIMNQQTGVGSYMISGGHNGGMVNAIITMTLLVGLMASAVNGVFIIAGLLSLISSAATINLFVGFIMSALSFAALFINFRIVDGIIQDYFYFLETGDLEAADRIAKETLGEGIALVVNVLMLWITDVLVGGKGGNVTAKDYGIDIDNLNFSDTVLNHIDRPYRDLKLLINEIIVGKTPVADPRGTTALYWEVEGEFNGTKGIYELLIDPESNTVWHFLFRGE